MPNPSVKRTRYGRRRKAASAGKLPRTLEEYKEKRKRRRLDVLTSKS
jgi:hypothetical protein